MKNKKRRILKESDSNVNSRKAEVAKYIAMLEEIQNEERATMNTKDDNDPDIRILIGSSDAKQTFTKGIRGAHRIVSWALCMLEEIKIRAEYSKDILDLESHINMELTTDIALVTNDNLVRLAPLIPTICDAIDYAEVMFDSEFLYEKYTMD